MSDPSGSSVPKAIGSLAKKQSDVTRQGTQKLKFTPTLPQRRKAEDVKQEPVTSPALPPSPTKPSRSRGGDARGAPRGRGRGVPPATEMTASGPFAMGPSQIGRGGATTDRSRSHSAFGSVDSDNPSRLSAGLSQTGPPSLGKESKHGKEKQIKVEDEEVYSDPDEGVEIVDMDQVQKMDWLAPDVLRRERRSHDSKIKQENLEDMDVDPGQALHPSGSEDEELEDVIEYFTARVTADTASHEELYFFQFPSPFPTFIKNKALDVDQLPNTKGKQVAFAPDVKPATPEAPEPKVSEPVSGAIGQLEVYRSGAIKMRLANDILLDVSASTQPSFLQQVVHLDKTEKQLIVLGEVNKQFVVSPNVEALLSAIDKETKKAVVHDENLIKME